MVGQNEVATLLIQTVLSTLLILVTAEFLPKATFQINPIRVLQLLLFPLMVIYALLYPLTIFTMTISNGVLRLFVMVTSNGEVAFSRIDLDHDVIDLNERTDEQRAL